MNPPKWRFRSLEDDVPFQMEWLSGLDGKEDPDVRNDLKI